jgi:hypothetical protein
MDASLALLKHTSSAISASPGGCAIVTPCGGGRTGAVRHFSEANGLAAWLTREGALGGLGESAALVLRDGARLGSRHRGHRAEKRDLGREDGAVLELKGSRRGSHGRGPLTTWLDTDRLSRLEQPSPPRSSGWRRHFPGRRPSRGGYVPTLRAVMLVWCLAARQGRARRWPTDPAAADRARLTTLVLAVQDATPGRPGPACPRRRDVHHQPALARPAHWRGFAHWRYALNSLNDGAAPDS